MKAWVIGIGASALVTASALAQTGSSGDGPFHRGPMGGRMLSAEDREAFLDARIAALRTALRLTPEQERLWPPVEEAIRGLAKQRQEARQARRERWAAARERGSVDIPSQIRFMADRRAASAEALRRLADASGPLYAALDEAQRRRLSVVARWMGRQGMRRMHQGRWHMRHGAFDGRTRDFARAEEPVAPLQPR